MPTPTQQFLVQPPQTTTVALEPAHNGFQSLLLLNWADIMSGLGKWIVETVETLPAELLHRNRVVVEGFYMALYPRQSWPSFSAYVDALAGEDPLDWRDRLLDAYAAMPCDDAAPVDQPERADLLADVELYLDYLRRRFPEEHINEAVERDAHALLQQPAALHDLAISHLRGMWDDYLADEWAQVRPMLQEAVDAFQQLDFAGQSTLEIARRVTGNPLTGGWEKALEDADNIVLIPSPHIGPYVSKFTDAGTVWLLFGARLPEGSHVRSPALNRSELLVRLNALADGTRLQILELLLEHDELCAQDFIARLDLSQSSVSRHLRQLSATGYLDERRQDAAKCYSINLDRVHDTLRAIEGFFDR